MQEPVLPWAQWVKNVKNDNWHPRRFCPPEISQLTADWDGSYRSFVKAKRSPLWDSSYGALYCQLSAHAEVQNEHMIFVSGRLGLSITPFLPISGIPTHVRYNYSSSISSRFQVSRQEKHIFSGVPTAPQEIWLQEATFLLTSHSAMWDVAEVHLKFQRQKSLDPTMPTLRHSDGDQPRISAVFCMEMLWISPGYPINLVVCGYFLGYYGVKKHDN